MEATDSQQLQRTCREPIFSESGVGYWCEIPLNHAGPHVTYSSVASRQARQAWESANPDLVGKSSDPFGDLIEPAPYERT